MVQDSGLTDMAFSFIRVAPRPPKPRTRGFTIVADRGIGLNRVSDIIDSAGEHVDFFKIAIGAFRLQREEFLRRKIAALKAANVRIFFAGDVGEAAFLQGVSKQFYQAAKGFGADAVEVSSAQVGMSLADKCELIEIARGCGLEVIAEVGQKGHSDWTRSQSYVFRQMERFQKAGCLKVLVQAEGISEGVDASKWDLILNLVAHFDVNDIIFQAKDSPSQEWYVTTLGNQVNLDVDDHQVIDVELMRRGIRKRSVFGLVGSLDRDPAGR
jgi:phosphosulfolactate synthase